MIPEGCVWNEVELQRGDPLNRGLLSLLITRDDLSPVLIGSAFIIKASGDRILAVSAAHCFEGIRNILHPDPVHHASALPEFLPVPKEIDLKRVKGVYVLGASVAACPIEQAWWDRDTDLALFTVIPPGDNSVTFKEFLLDNTMPDVGDPVTMVGFGDMAVTPDANEPQRGIMQRRLVVRLGRVEEVYPERYYMLKIPCVQTSVAVFSGMSGGMVLRGWPEPTGTPRPFALISRSLSEDDPQSLYDRSKSGRSFAATLPIAVEALDDGQQMVRFNLNNMGYGRTIA
jgi:hypothetical protein